ncbi:MAG: hypothetical protein EXR07_04735 [Acetobacteraceae bacterium]|nr:hypothetical protein [Acetobacteraceae bacterium]
MTFLSRRAALFLPPLLAACGGDEPSRPPPRGNFPPLRYGFLPPIGLNVQRVEMAEGFIRPAGDGELSDGSAAETLFAMARDRLKPVAPNGTAMFRIVTASIARRRDTLNGTLAVRLDVRNEDGTSSGYAEARVNAEKTGPISDQRTAAHEMLKALMDDMNVELEFQIRSKLRAWIVEPPVEPVPPAPINPSVKIPPPPPAPPRS